MISAAVSLIFPNAPSNKSALSAQALSQFWQDTLEDTVSSTGFQPLRNLQKKPQSYFMWLNNEFMMFVLNGHSGQERLPSV